MADPRQHHGGEWEPDREPVGHDAMLGKVRKLLAKAEATDNANEADAFSLKAAQLIAAHRISPERLARTDDEQLLVRRIVIGRGGYVRARLALLGAIARAHDAEVVFESGPAGATALVAGFADDLEATAVLYASLHVQAAGQMAAIRRASPAATQRWRRSFLFGFAARIAETLRAASDAAGGDGTTGTGSASTGTHLPDLAARAARVRQFAAVAFGRVVPASAPRPAAAAAWGAGHRAAGGADIGRRRLPGREALGPAPGWRPER